MTTLHLIMYPYLQQYTTSILDLLSILAPLCAILVIINKNPIVSILFLICLFIVISGYLLTLGMKFIAISYLLVYIGAVSILFLFILMLINIRISEIQTETTNTLPLAIAMSSPSYVILHPICSSEITKPFSDPIDGVKPTDLLSYHTNYVTTNQWDNNIVEVMHISGIGNVLYTNYFLWIILTSIILLLAMIGTIIITIRSAHEEFNYSSFVPYLGLDFFKSIYKKCSFSQLIFILLIEIWILTQLYGVFIYQSPCIQLVFIHKLFYVKLFSLQLFLIIYLNNLKYNTLFSVKELLRGLGKITLVYFYIMIIVLSICFYTDLFGFASGLMEYLCNSTDLSLYIGNDLFQKMTPMKSNVDIKNGYLTLSLGCIQCYTLIYEKMTQPWAILKVIEYRNEMLNKPTNYDMAVKIWDAKSIIINKGDKFIKPKL